MVPEGFNILAVSILPLFTIKDTAMTKSTFVVEFKLAQEEVEQFTVTVKNATDITDAIYKAQDIAKSAMNLSVYDDAPQVKSIHSRGW
jgi:hypothetical protein